MYFFGHRDTPTNIKVPLKKTLELMIQEGVKDFFVGNNGNFDYLVQEALEDNIKQGADINMTVVLSYVDEQAIRANQIFTIYPEGLEKTPHRFAISKRNDWLISKADIVVVYVKHNLSNAHKWLDKANKKGCRVINLAKL